MLYSKDDWLALIKAMVLGIGGFNFHGKAWRPVEYGNPGCPDYMCEMPLGTSESSS